MRSTVTLKDRDIEYCRLRATGQSPLNAYRGAEFSLQTGSVKANIERKEKNNAIIAKIAEFKRVLLQEGNTTVKSVTKVQAEEVHREIAKPVHARKMDEGEIEQSLTDLHSKAVLVGDLGTARQCLVDLGKNKGMFTPIQKIKFETVDDLNIDDTEALIKKLMAAKEAEQQAPPVEEEPEGTAAVVQ